MSVLDEVNYTLEGDCCKCGDCCRFLYCVENLNEWTFRLLTLFRPSLWRFRIIGKDENGIILACKLIMEDGICPDYNNRPAICRDFPNPNKVHSGGRLYKRCTYRLVPEKSFGSFLPVEEEGQKQPHEK